MKKFWIILCVTIGNITGTVSVTTLQQILELARNEGARGSQFVQRILELEKSERAKAENPGEDNWPLVQTQQMKMRADNQELSDTMGRSPILSKSDSLRFPVSEENLAPPVINVDVSAPIGSVNFTIGANMSVDGTEERPPRPRITINPEYAQEYFFYRELESESKNISPRQILYERPLVTSSDPVYIRISEESKLYFSPGETQTIHFQIENRGTSNTFHLEAVDRGIYRGKSEITKVDFVLPDLSSFSPPNAGLPPLPENPTFPGVPPLPILQDFQFSPKQVSDYDVSSSASPVVLVRERMIFPGETSFLQDIHPESLLVQANTTQQFEIQVSIPENAKPGTRHLLRVLATPEVIPNSPETSFQPPSTPFNSLPETTTPPSPPLPLVANVEIMVMAEPPDISDLLPPTCKVLRDTWLSVCSTWQGNCQDEEWEVRLNLQDADTGLRDVLISHPGTYWERSDWDLGSREEEYVEWRGTCCVDQVAVSSWDAAGRKGVCQTGRQIIEVQEGIAWIVVTVVMVMLMLVSVGAGFTIWTIRRRTKAQLQEMRQLPQAR